MIFNYGKPDPETLENELHEERLDILNESIERDRELMEREDNLFRETYEPMPKEEVDQMWEDLYETFQKNYYGGVK